MMEIRHTGTFHSLAEAVRKHNEERSHMEDIIRKYVVCGWLQWRPKTNWTKTVHHTRAQLSRLLTHYSVVND